MADHTHIEWTDATWNPITGCTVISPGCTNCYAMRLAGGRLKNHPSRAGLTRATKAGPVWTGEIRVNDAWMDQPLRWQRPRMIFVNAHSDLFHEDVPDPVIDRVFAVMALAPHHQFQVLTKRADRMRAYLTDPKVRRRIYELVCDRVVDESLRVVLIAPGADERLAPAGPRIYLDQWPLPSVWLGVSAEDQARADERIPDLLATPAAVRFVSLEPLLGPVDLTAIQGKYGDRHEVMDALRGTATGWPGSSGFGGRAGMGGWPKLDWVIVGGENGPRPIRSSWVRPIRDQCHAAGVPFFFKQWGDHLPEGQFDVDGFQWAPGEHDGRVHWWGEPPAYGDPIPDDACAVRIGKAQAGRTLDGRTWDERPGV